MSITTQPDQSGVAYSTRRCQRNCFNCPICTAPLSVNSIGTDSGGVLQGPWVLACAYCSWSSLEIGVQFDKPNNISGQLEKLKNGRGSHTTPRAVRHLDDGYANPEDNEQLSEKEIGMNPDEHFSTLKSFYSSQLNDPSTNPPMSPSGDQGYSSPNALARIMSMYTGLGNYSKTAKARPKTMQEARGSDEGAKTFDPAYDADAIRKMQQLGWDGMPDMAQRSTQHRSVRFLDDVKPVATLLRTKRSKRCRTCRHILVKPESKVQSTRFRIRLVALNYVPRMTLKPLHPASVNFEALSQARTMQVLLTLTNPLFDPVKITLATPTYTPGRFQSKITVLCPQFEVGANTDVWDDALNAGGSTSREGKGLKVNGELGDGEKQAEAGKVWEKGRNWSTVVVEITTPSLDPGSKAFNIAGKMETREAMEDEDVLEIPMFVRIEYEADAAGDEVGTTDKGKKEKRELAYWSVICVGRIV